MRSTGVRLAQPRRQPATKLIHSIGPITHRQFSHARRGSCGRASLLGRVSQCPPIPLRKRFRSRHPNLWSHHDTRNRRQIHQRINLLPPPHSQHRPANQEQREIRPHLGRNPQSFRSWQSLFQNSFQSQQTSHRIRRCPAQSALHRKLLLNLDHHSTFRIQRL